MNKKQLDIFFDAMTKAVLEGGKLARENQGKVANLGKEIEKFSGEPDIYQTKRSAKTIIDEQVQEILLKAVCKVLDPKTIFLDAEEDTPLVKLFSKSPLTTSIIIDPIDGTLEYLQGTDVYNICIALVENGKMVCVLVYFPKRDHLYFLSPNSKSYLAHEFSKKGIKNATVLKVKKSKSKKIYVNDRVPKKIINAFVKSGYKIYNDVETDIPWPTGFLALLSGEFTFTFFRQSQARDILLGPIVKGAGGISLDWSGKELIWPQKGRVPQALFGSGKLSIEVLKCLD